MINKLNFNNTDDSRRWFDVVLFGKKFVYTYIIQKFNFKNTESKWRIQDGGCLR